MNARRWPPFLALLLIVAAVAAGLIALSFQVEQRAGPVEVLLTSSVVEGLPVEFQPLQESIQVAELGRPYRATYRMVNLSDETITVQPLREIRGSGSVEAIQIVRCFCWIGHELQPHETVEFPLWVIVGNGLLGGAPGDFALHWTVYPSEDGVPRAGVAAPANHDEDVQAHAGGD